MTEPMTCQTCGIPLVGATVEGLCPACLLRSAMPPTRDGNDGEAVESPPTLRYFGNYELLGEIARGGMGVVYKARQASLNRVVAVKTILAGQFAGEEAVRRFRAEAEAAANLQHPNIVAIHEVGEVEGFHYFSMEYVEGKNLSQVLRDGLPPPEEAARLLQKVALAIQYAHQRGILHRDLKPSNILLDDRGEPRITDFGLAKVIGEDGGLTRSDLVVGSPSYMSPEQASGRADLLGPSTDVYALGAILYEMLTGRPPHAAGSADALLVKVVNDDPQPPRRVKPEAPVDLETICLKCLEKSPTRRYASARELAEDLGRHLRREPILARPVGTARRAVEWLRRHPRGLLATGAVLFLGLACLAFGLWEQNKLLRWMSAHPDFTPAKGPRTHALNAAEFTSFWVFLTVILSKIGFNRLRGVRLSDLHKSAWNTHPALQTPATPGILAAQAGLGAISTLFALFLLARLIAAHVWEGYPLLGTPVGMIYALAFFGPMLVLRSIQDQRTRLFGRPGRVDQPLPDAVRESLLDALRRRDPVLAFRLYRQHTSCTLAEAKFGVDRFAQKHGLDLPPAIIDAKRLAVALGIAAAVTGALALVLQAPWRIPVMAELAGGAFAGVFLLLSLRLKGYWRRTLLFMPGMLLLIGVHEWCKSKYPDHALYGLSMAGMFAGMAVVLCSYKKPA